MQVPWNDGPSDADLAVIEAEWPLIAAEIDLVDAEIRILTGGTPSALDWRRVRRAERRVAAEALVYAAGPAAVRLVGVA